MNRNLKPALWYDLKDYCRAAGIFLAAIVLIMTLLAVHFTLNGKIGYSSFTGAGAAATIFMFVLGVSDNREKLRIMNQFGLSRRTAYTASLLALAALSGLLAAALEVINGLFQLSVAGSAWLFAGDLYQIIYLGGADHLILTLEQHVTSMCFSACLMLALAVFGQFFSLLFWRLSKLWTVAVAIAIPVVFNLIPWAAYRVSMHIPAAARAARALLGCWAANPWSFMLTCLLFAAAAVAVNWLLLRRAVIRASK